MNTAFELIYPLRVHTSLFIGKKPSAILFGDERVDVKTWRQVVGVILTRCDSEHHERLMYLRDKVHGKIRTIFSASDFGMRRPLKIREDMYIETHYGSATMMYILRDLILAYTGFDCSDIRIVIKQKCFEGSRAK
jgi:hypothetical protein